MTRTRRSVGEAIRKGFSRRGVPHERAEIILNLLVADGPMTSHEIAERLEVPFHMVMGSNGALDHLLADGRVYTMKGHGMSRMYYATESENES
jgi:predicted ArsR family transcriptional regulator